MSPDTEQQSGIEVLAVPRLLKSVFAAFTSSISSGVHATTVSGRSWPRASACQEVIRGHPQPDPPLHATDASVPAPPESVTAFEGADASFAACAPAQSGAGRARPGLSGLAGQ